MVLESLDKMASEFPRCRIEPKMADISSKDFDFGIRIIRFDGIVDRWCSSFRGHFGFAFSIFYFYAWRCELLGGN